MNKASLNCTMNRPRSYTGKAHQLDEQKVELLLGTRKRRSHPIKFLHGNPANL